MNLVENIFKAGVVGAGGAGFPTHIKVQAKVDTVIGNGAECEPLLATDRQAAVHFAEEIVGGLKLVMEATGAEKGIIGIKEKYEDALSAVSLVLEIVSNITIHKLGNYYPAGDEFSLVKDATGRLIPEGGIPLNVGVVVNNINTLRNIYFAHQGTPVTNQIVTVNGEVKNPMVLNVPIGTHFRDLIEICGGVTTEDYTLLIGGPMMGRISDDIEAPVTKTTTGLIVLPSDHSYIVRKKRPLEQDIRWSQSQCEQCRDCTEFCPRWLQGHSLAPHMAMRVIDYNLDSEPHAKTITSSMLCSECGICDLYSCPMNLSPRIIFKEFKKRLIADGIKNPHNNAELQERALAGYRNVPKDRLLQRLEMERYDVYPKLVKEEINVGKVKIPVQQHIGTKAEAMVKPGDIVGKGDMIASIPEGKLGANIHASISGKIESVGEHIIILKQ
ncbi:MAG: SLBB domain-containing protein [Nitrospinae bacterium]|nr:SLBB domain-containing protein [Nitrospinota bacterium]